MPTKAIPPSAADLAGRLRISIARLARLMRQQDQSGFGPTVVSVLATVERLGPITLGELATREQVAPPTITKVVERLEANGLLTRATDTADRRVSRVAITTKGSRRLETYRTRRTEWLSARLRDLGADEHARLVAALPVLERLIEVPELDP